MAGPDASPSWSDLPTDLLIRILYLLELPEVLAFQAVCLSWRSSSTAAGSVAPRRRPWLVSLKEPLQPGDPQLPRWRGLSDPAAASELRSLLDAERTFKFSFSHGQVVALCGAAHGWIIVANQLSNLVLYNPFTSVSVPLPPITGFDLCIQGVYGGQEGRTLVGYRYGCYKGAHVYDLHSLGGYFYDKVVLSGSPSAGSCAVALAIHLDGKRLSSARVGDSRWQQISRIRRPRDSFADCVYHRGRFYAVTMRGRLKCLDLGGPGEPRKKTVIGRDDDNFDDVITRYLISTPWGRLLQVRVVLDAHQVNNVRVELGRLDMKSQKMVALSSAEALRGHSAFVGQNNPGLLPTKEFPQLKPDCIYFTTPRLREHAVFDNRCNRWNGVKVYDLKKGTLEAAFPSGGGPYGTWCPSEVWLTPSL